VFVCHGNLIRAIVMHALELPMTKWIKLDIHHGSITTLTIRKDGHRRLLAFNDHGHMPPSMITEV
jgi:broad specificity phosphatase PhoE